MTEAEWLACDNPGPMLAFLNGKASVRHMTLFACACCRRIWDLLSDPRSRAAVETAERHADGLASEEELIAARGAAHDAYMQYHVPWRPAPDPESVPDDLATALAETPEELAADWDRLQESVRRTFEEVNRLFNPTEEERAARWAATPMEAAARYAAYNASCSDTEGNTAYHAAEARTKSRAIEPGDQIVAWNAEALAQADLLRDLFGSPSRPVVVAPAWLAWQGGALTSLARDVYNQRRFVDLPLLADLLAEAGCGDEELLNHLRRPGEHARGCWALDALLGQPSPVHLGLNSRAGWDSCLDPVPLLHVLGGQGSERQWRLFAVACCRHIAPLMTDARSHRAVAAAERCADGLATAEELADACAAASAAAGEAHFAEWVGEAEANFCLTAEYCALRAAGSAADAALAAAEASLAGTAAAPHQSQPAATNIAALMASLAQQVQRTPEPRPCWESAAWAAAGAAQSRAYAEWEASGEGNFEACRAVEEAAKRLEEEYQARLLHCIFGQFLGPPSGQFVWVPFGGGGVRRSRAPSRLDVRLDRLWVERNGGAALTLARTIDEEQAFDRMPTLADALEEAGCDDIDILSHCRGPGPHARGCWVLDLLLIR